MMELYRDVWAISECGSLVASFSSSVAWIAYELQIARAGHYTPYVSVDLPWAHKRLLGHFVKENRYDGSVAH